MNRNLHKFDPLETALYISLALIPVILVFYLFYFKPVLFTQMVMEDHWGEYGTAVSYALAGFLMISLAFRRGPCLRRTVWAIIGLLAVFIAGEEISWGQRIFRFSLPMFFRQASTLNELNLHNIETLGFLESAAAASYVMLVWAIFSAVTSFRLPRLQTSIEAVGLPLIPIRLLPFCLTVPCFYLFTPIVKSAEIGELLLGIAWMVFAFDLFLRHGYTKHPGRWPAVGATFGLLVLVAAMSVALAHFFPVPHKWMLNTLATRDYASFGMYGQAHRIYEYMYENPQYLTSKTRIHHGKLLLKMGQREEAFRILSQAARNLESVNHQKAPRSKDLRRLATIHALMGRADEAGAGFDRAIEIDRKKLDLISDVDKKSEVMFSMAKTYEARGETATAIEWARYARANTSSPRFRSRIDKWLKALASRKEGRRYK